MKNAKLILGIVAIVALFTLNLCHTFNDYGILDNKLQTNALAQANGTSPGGRTTPGGGTTPSGNTTNFG